MGTWPESAPPQLPLLEEDCQQRLLPLEARGVIAAKGWATLLPTATLLGSR